MNTITRSSPDTRLTEFALALITVTLTVSAAETRAVIGVESFSEVKLAITWSHSRAPVTVTVVVAAPKPEMLGGSQVTFAVITVGSR